MVYDVQSDGSIHRGRVLFHATAWSKGKPGAPDGMKVDHHGNIFAAGPGGVHVISPAGKHLGSIETGAPTGNVAWGEDGSSLFVAANSSLFRLRLRTKGARF
jgi:gluconolactonase